VFDPDESAASRPHRRAAARQPLRRADGQLRLIAVQIEGDGITRWVNENEPSDAGVVA